MGEVLSNRFCDLCSHVVSSAEDNEVVFACAVVDFGFITALCTHLSVDPPRELSPMIVPLNYSVPVSSSFDSPFGVI